MSQEVLLEKEMATHSSILAWENPMDRGTYQATVHAVAESDTTTQQLNNKNNKMYMQLIARQKIKDNYKTDKHLLLV